MSVLESLFNFIKKRLQNKRRSGVFIVNFEQVNVYWERILFQIQENTRKH